MSIKVRIKSTGEIVEVTRNEAHEFVEKGTGEVVTQTPPKAPVGYQTRQIRPEMKYDK